MASEPYVWVEVGIDFKVHARRVLKSLHDLPDQEGYTNLSTTWRMAWWMPETMSADELEGVAEGMRRDLFDADFVDAVDCGYDYYHVED